MQGALPHWPAGNLRTVRVDNIPIELTTASVNVHLVRAQPAASLPEVANDPEEEDDGEGEVDLEEALGGVQAGLSNWSSDSGVELQGSDMSASKGEAKHSGPETNLPER